MRKFGSVNLTCTNQGLVTWTHNHILTQNETDHIMVIEEVLHLQNVTSLDVGNYSCYRNNVKYRTYNVKFAGKNFS